MINCAVLWLASLTKYKALSMMGLRGRKMISRCCMRRRVKAGLGTLMGIKGRNLGEAINSVANRRRRGSGKTTLPKARNKSSKPQYRTTPNFQKGLKKYCAALKNVVSNSKKRDGEKKMSLSAEQDKQCHGYEDYEEEIDNLYRCAPCKSAFGVTYPVCIQKFR